MFFDDPGFACYAIHKDSIEEFINLLAKEDDPNDSETQMYCARICNLDWKLLDIEEKSYIESEVSRKWQMLH